MNLGDVVSAITRANLLLLLLLAGSGCAVNQQFAPNPDLPNWVRAPGMQDGPRKLIVFLDGTSNDWHSRTNVRRLFELIAVREDPRVLTLFVDGVGSPDSGPIAERVLGLALGWGMKARILAGYEFLALQYRPGDEIYIFGFSRGAFEARALAGMLAYDGLIQASKEKRSELKSDLDKLWDLTRYMNDKDDGYWRAWNPEMGPPFAADIKREIGVDTRVVEIAFLGVWDTVPGSAFKTYSNCEEQKDRAPGTRYKIRPYPTTRFIAHAMAYDEKRSQFRPVRMCDPFDRERTKLHEVWFPGAHADIGGGYEDSNDLAGVTLNWMLDMLEGQGIPGTRAIRVHADPGGLAHWSISDWPYSEVSDLYDRCVPEGWIKHKSFDERVKRSEEMKTARPKGVPVRRAGAIQFEQYPAKELLTCTDESVAAGK